MSSNTQGIRTNNKGAVVQDRWDYEVAKGRVNGISFVSKFGENRTSANGVWETVWDGSNGIYPFPNEDVASGVIITSNSDFDEPADGEGTLAGAQSIHIYGLASGTWALQDEVVAMSGTSVKDYIRIFRAFVVGAGVSGTNVGDISIKMNTVEVGKIIADEGQTLMCVYTIASGVTGFIHRKEAGVLADDGATVKTSDFRLRTRIQGEAIRSRDTIGLKDNSVSYDIKYPLELVEMTDIWIDAKTNTNSTKVTAGFDIELQDNDI